MDEDEYDEWLASESTWKGRIGEGWIGKKVLGKGGFGVVGLWEYEGDSNSSPAIKKIAVKQQAQNFSLEDEDLEEGRILALLSTAQSRHIIRIFGKARLDTYGGTNVSRIFLEYCPGGTLEKLLEDPKGERYSLVPKKPMAEADIWAIFYCLALGVAVMDRRTEDPNATPSNTQTVVVHYDITPDNVFMGYKDPDHPRYPIVKIADFGEAVEEARNMAYTEENREKGQMNYNPPEIRSQGMELLDKRFGTCTNVFQVGCIAHTLITRQAKDFNHLVLYMSGLNNDLKNGFTHGEDMDDPSIAAIYSNPLRALVMECMLREPNHRPDALSLQKRTAAGLAAALKEAAAKNIFDADPNPFADILSMENAWLEPPWSLLDEDEFDDSGLGSSPLASSAKGTTPSVPGSTPPRKGSGSGSGGGASDRDPAGGSPSRPPKRRRSESPEVGGDDAKRRVRTGEIEGGDGGDEGFFEAGADEECKTGDEEGRCAEDPDNDEEAYSDGEEGSDADEAPIGDGELGSDSEQDPVGDGELGSDSEDPGNRESDEDGEGDGEDGDGEDG